MRVLMPALFAVQWLIGCATHSKESLLAACGDQPDSLEGRIAATPEDASTLRDLADMHRFFHSGSPPFHTEVWVALTNGDLMLCRADSKRGAYVAGEWWRFHSTESSHELVDNSGWLVQQ
jgi:hypothetical protein